MTKISIKLRENDLKKLLRYLCDNNFDLDGFEITTIETEKDCLNKPDVDWSQILGNQSLRPDPVYGYRVTCETKADSSNISALSPSLEGMTVNLGTFAEMSKNVSSEQTNATACAGS